MGLLFPVHDAGKKVPERQIALGGVSLLSSASRFV